MKRLMMILALIAPMAMAAPAVVGTASTATSGTSHVLAVPAGAAGDLLVAVVAGDYSLINRRFGVVPGWSNRTLNACGRPSGVYFKVSDGTETSLTATSNVSMNAQTHVLRVSGYTSAYLHGFHTRGFNSPAGEMYPDPHNIIMPAVLDTLWVVGLFNNGGSPTLYPSGYGFQIDAANTARAVLAFKSATAYSDDPGVFTLPAPVPSCAVTFGIY